MALADIISGQRNFQKTGMSRERVEAQMPHIRQYIAFWREYPDIFVDFLCGYPEPHPGTLKLFFYQRVFLRAAMRHRVIYATFPRAYSKSFLAFLILSLRAILYPNSKLFVTTGGKEQAAGIAKEKVQELCTLIPGLKNEIDWTRGHTREAKDFVEYIFLNGSHLDVMAATQASRGKRRTGGLIEECILVDGTVLNEVIIPTMNVDRLLPDGTHHEKETVNKSQIYITTAGWKSTFAYKKLMETLIRSLLYPDDAIVIGGTWRIPVMEGLLSKNFVSELKASGTFNPDSFDREYGSIWCGDAENAYFNGEEFNKHRVLLQPEYEYSARSNKNAYYILGVDVGRKGCNTEICVIKATPQVQGSSIKTVVNLYSEEDQHFEDQAVLIKKLYYKYKARTVVLDGNGIGIGLVDYLIKPTVDNETGDILPPFGVENDEEGFYKKFKTPDTEVDALYIMKANAPINTEAHSYARTQIASGKVRFLIDEVQAQTKYLGTKVGREATPAKRASYIKPFMLTSFLKEQMMNLVETNEGVNIILKPSDKKIPKDKFSAFEYALYYIKKAEDNKRRRHKRDVTKMMFFNSK